jgi:hypothetical protein
MQVIRIELHKVQVKDNDVKTPQVQKNKELMRPANNLLVLPQYNKPKKSNMAQVMPQGDSSSIETNLFKFGN